jgi:hypothetical protein
MALSIFLKPLTATRHFRMSLIAHGVLEKNYEKFEPVVFIVYGFPGG